MLMRARSKFAARTACALALCLAAGTLSMGAAQAQATPPVEPSPALEGAASTTAVKPEAPASEATPVAETAKPGDDAPPTQEQVRARKEARQRAEEEAAANPPPPPAPKPVKIAAPVVVADDVVPGCAPGRLCTVCVAGCVGPTRGIVHAKPNSSVLTR